MDPQHIGEAVVGGLVVAKQLLDFIGGRARDRRHSAGQTSLRAELQKQFADIKLELEQLRAFVIGPDGQNGIRGDVRKAEKRLDDLEERELQRLQPQQVGTFSPR